MPRSRGNGAHSGKSQEHFFDKPGKSNSLDENSQQLHTHLMKIRMIAFSGLALCLLAGLFCALFAPRLSEQSGPPGSVDKTFAPVDVNNSVFAIGAQPDGRIIIGGAFTSVNGEARWLLAAITATGAVDRDFKSGLTKEDLSLVRALASLPNGTVLVGADSGIFGLSRNGTPDKHFHASTDGHVRTIMVEADGQVLVGGHFKTIGGQPRDGIARLKDDGSIDGFNLSFPRASNAASYVSDVAPAQGSGYYLSGAFHPVGAPSALSLVKVTGDGRLDTNFVSAVSGKINNLALQPDGKLLVAGEFVGRRIAIARLLASGGLDETFDAGFSTSDPSISAIILRADEKILAAGPRFTSVRHKPCPGFACLNADGSPDPAFAISPEAALFTDCMAMQRDGKIILTSTAPPGGTFPRGLVRLIGTPIVK